MGGVVGRCEVNRGVGVRGWMEGAKGENVVMG